MTGPVQPYQPGPTGDAALRGLLAELIDIVGGITEREGNSR